MRRKRKKKLRAIVFQKKTLCVCSHRERIKGAFLDALEDELSYLGWLLVQIDESTMAIVKKEKAVTWLKLSSKRLKDISLVKADDESIDAAYEKEFPMVDEENSVEDDD